MLALFSHFPTYLVQKTQILSLWYFFWVCDVMATISKLVLILWDYTSQLSYQSQLLSSNVMHFTNEPSFAIILKKCQSFLNGLCARAVSKRGKMLMQRSALKISHYAQIQFHNAQNNIISERVCILGFFAGNYDLNFKHGVCVCLGTA